MPELPQIIANGGINVPRPERAPEGGAFRPLANEAENMKFIARNAMRDEEVGQVSSAIGDFMLQRDDIQKKLSTVTNPDAYLAHYHDSLAAANNDILSRFSSSPMKDRLAGELKIHMAESLSSATAHATALQVKAGQDAINTALKTYAPVAATSPDPKDRDYAQNQAFGLIQSNKYTTEDEKALQWQAFNKSVDIMGLQSRIASNDPNVLMELHSPDFQKQHPLIAPEEQMALTNHAVSQMTEGYRMVEAQTKAQIGANEMRLNAEAAQGKNIGPELENLRKFRGVSEEFYEAHTGHPFTQSMPGVAESFVARIKEAQAPEDLDGITQEAYIASDHNQLGSKDLSAINHAAAIAKGTLKQTAKQQELWGKSELDKTFFPPKSFIDKYDLGPKLSRESVMTFYDMKLLEHKGNAPQAVEDTKEHFKDYMKNGSGSGAVGRLLGGPTP